MPGYRLGTCLGCPEAACELSIVFALLASVLQAASLDFVFASERLLQSPGPFEGNRSVKSFIVLPRRTAVFSRANLEQLASAAACASFTLVITCASLLIAGKDTSVQLH